MNSIQVNVNILKLITSDSRWQIIKRAKAIEKIIKEVLLNKITQEELNILNEILSNRRKFLKSISRTSLEVKIYGITRGNSYGQKYETQPHIGLKKVKLDEYAQEISIPHWFGSLLFLLAFRLECRSILEIGTAFGISTSYLLQAIKDRPKSYLLTMESWDLPYKYYHRLFKNFNKSKLRIYKGYDYHALPKSFNTKRKYDFAFIDAEHKKESLIYQVKTILPHLSSMGLIVLDDINWSPEMKEGWDEVKNNNSIVYSIEEKKFGVLLKA